MFIQNIESEYTQLSFVSKQANNISNCLLNIFNFDATYKITLLKRLQCKHSKQTTEISERASE